MSMEFRRLGRTNLKVSAVSLGGAQLEADVIDELQAKKIINEAVSLGMNFIDTAVKYKEEKLKLALNENKNKIIIASKSTAGTREGMAKDLKGSLQKMSLEKIHLYQLHGLDEERGMYDRINNTLKALKEARKEGLIDWIGVHGQNIPTLVKAVKTEEFDTVMLPYNYAYDEAEGLIDLAYDFDVGIIVMEPFGRGLLVNPDRMKIDHIKNNKEILNHETALKWILSNRKISTVIPGGNRIEYIQKNAQVGNSYHSLSKKERKTIHKTVKNLVKDEYFRICNNPWQ